MTTPIETPPTRASAARRVAGLYRVEIALLLLIHTLLAAGVLRDIASVSVVEWRRFAPLLSGALGLVALGAVLRARWSAPRLAVLCISMGVFAGYSLTVAILIFQMFPFQAPSIDPWLTRLDARLGYDWPSFVRALAEVPTFGRLLGTIYDLAIPQLLVVIFLLSRAGRERALHRFLCVGVSGLASVVAIGHFWPSMGPSVLNEVPAESARIGLVVDSAYAAQLRSYAVDGVPVIQPEVIMGVFAFPSFHMFMALMGFWFGRGTGLSPALAVVSLLMVPATLSHGGHHLVDLLGALALFPVLAVGVGRLLPDPASEAEVPRGPGASDRRSGTGG